MRKRGFTLIELLVVIAIMALLMAILLSSLHRVRKQAKALACQSNLRQWGTIWATTTAENDGYFPGWNPDELWPDHEPLPRASPAGRGWWDLRYWCRDWYDQTEGIRCCPMATKIPHPGGQPGEGRPVGGTFLAWGRMAREGKYEWDTYGSYGINLWVYQPRYRESQWYPYFWGTSHVSGASNIPVELDNYWSSGFWFDFDGPPPCDAVPNPPVRHLMCWGHSSFCMNRHDGGINGLFMDWSVRKVGLKELWTLKWSRKFDTANAWTKAGGVRAEDWPKWMRGFKDY